MTILQRGSFILFSNNEIRSPSSWASLFCLQFFLKNSCIAELRKYFLKKNRGKRDRPNSGVIVSLLLTTIFCFFSTTLLANSANPDQLSFIIGTESAKMGEEMCVEVMACNFDLIGFQFTISWNEDIVGFSRVEKPNIPYFLQSSYQEFEGMFRVAWINENLTAPVALPDSSAVFTLCFTPKRPGTSALVFDSSVQTPLHPEFIGLDGAEAAVLVPGAITVLGCSTTATEISQQICNGASFEGYTQGGQYTDTFQDAAGCDSTRVLNLSISTTIESTINASICEGENYGGRVQAGTYMDTYQSVNSGCDSIRTLNLRVLPSIQQQVTQTICAGSCMVIGGTNYCASQVVTNTLTASSGCDSIVTINLIVTNQITGFSSVEICSGDAWIEGGNSVREAGAATFNYTSATGCDSLHTVQVSFYQDVIATREEVSICEGANYGGRTQAGVYADTYNNINGCDSVHTIILSIAANLETRTSASICTGESFNGYTASGEYRNAFVTASGCDSISILNLVVEQAIENTMTQSICAGESFNGYTASGEYRNAFVTTSGCDSISILNLVVEQVIENRITQSICAGESFNGYTASGEYRNAFVTTSGCDSISILNLVVAQTIESTMTQSICAGESFNGYTASGEYRNTYTTASGCDSISTLNLIVQQPIENSITQSICEGSVAFGYTNSGQYRDVFVSHNGCDSIRVLNLIVASSISTSIETAICEGENFEGYTASGTYTNLFTANSGCDSIRTLRLTVGSKIETIIEVTICEGESYEGFDRTGNFLNLFQSVSGCDSIRELRLKVSPRLETVISTAICDGENFEGYTDAGSYINNFVGQNGCDSIRVLNLSILPAEDSSCGNSTTPTINIDPLVSLNYFPNPVATNLYLDWNGDAEATYSIMDLSGRTLLPNSLLQASTIVDVQHFNAGVYYLKINSGGRAYYAKLIKL